jgi:hypothetical protein
MRTRLRNTIIVIFLVLSLITFPGGNVIGFIQFTLHTNSADYVVYNANNGGVVDSGTVNCH